MSMPGFTMNMPGQRARGGNPTAGLIAVVLFVLAGIAVEEGARQGTYTLFWLAGVLALIGVLVPSSLKMANHWERAVVLRLGRLQSVSGPGLFVIVPIIDQVVYWLDQRIQTTEFNAEQALSKDTVPVDVDAVVFWQIHDPERAALEITDYRSAISRVAQTSLREMVGSSLLSTLLSDRKHGDEMLREEIGRKTAEWGVTAISVEIRDIGVPAALQDAMSREAQAQREAAARIHLGQAELAVAEKFVEAAEIYARSPAALQLRHDPDADRHGRRHEPGGPAGPDPGGDDRPERSAGARAGAGVHSAASGPQAPEQRWIGWGGDDDPQAHSLDRSDDGRDADDGDRAGRRGARAGGRRRVAWRRQRAGTGVTPNRVALKKPWRRSDCTAS
jgi:regulator of protease activity HflC (stomatin/prohibitin superfamily)